MALAMLASFDPEDLRRVPQWRLFPLSDESSYGEMFKAVKQVVDGCISPYSSTNSSTHAEPDFLSDTGWKAVGMYSHLFSRTHACLLMAIINT